MCECITKQLSGFPKKAQILEKLLSFHEKVEFATDLIWNGTTCSLSQKSCRVTLLPGIKFFFFFGNAAFDHHMVIGFLYFIQIRLRKHDK